jgi:hypothetical protein
MPREPQAPKALAIDVFVELHRLHFSGRIIGELTGFSPSHVSRILCDVGMHERWSDVADVRAGLPLALRESCDRLVSVRAVRPAAPHAWAGARDHQREDLKRA